MVRGYNVMRGYFNDSEATDEAIDIDRWLHTGDVGVMDADGNVTITDRLKDMYVSGGFNVYPAEVEASSASIPRSARWRWSAYPTGAWGGGPGPGGAGRGIRPRERRRCPGVLDFGGELIDWARERMANYKVPRGG